MQDNQTKTEIQARDVEFLRSVGIRPPRKNDAMWALGPYSLAAGHTEIVDLIVKSILTLTAAETNELERRLATAGFQVVRKSGGSSE